MSCYDVEKITVNEIAATGNTHPAFLHTLRHHDDVVDVLLPHHLPEVVFGPWERTLSGDVLPSEVVTLKVIKYLLDTALDTVLDTVMQLKI